MLQLICQNCGQPNPDVARVCRYCGHALQPDAAPRPADYDPRPADYAQRPADFAPRSDEYPPPGSYAPTHDWASSAPLPQPPAYTPQPQPQTQMHALLSAENFRCPFCQTTQRPVVARRISTGGWIVFAALLVACLPLCFIGLLIKEEYPMCSWCRASLS